MGHIIVTDPSYVRNPTEYQVNILDRAADSTVRLSVRVPVTAALLSSIGSKKSHLVGSRETDESFYQFGNSVTSSLRDWELIGWHGSDSGMTCIIHDDPFQLQSSSSSSAMNDELTVDAMEFALATMQDPQMERDMEEFPLFQWFGRIPEAASSIRVYGCDRDVNGCFSGLILRAGSDEVDTE